jgi:N-acetylglucosaminyldiphosphoundecaprenol N-acetyl-beta-D-mannosaminyltransferase
MATGGVARDSTFVQRDVEDLSDARLVQVGPFSVVDATRHETVGHLVALALGPARQRAVTAFALHVGGLNAKDDGAFVSAMNSADFVYADGGSVVWLARRNGATKLERAATTDIGWDVLRGIGEGLGRPPRVTLVGGPPGLALRAAASLDDAGVAVPVLVQHGFHRSWPDHVARISEAAADVVLVGMGAPAEMTWAHRWAPSIDTGLLLTCGGWFGFLAGEERRAPRPIRRSGLEWMSRLAQQPMRLGPRYVRGAVTTAQIAREGRRSIPAQASAVEG